MKIDSWEASKDMFVRLHEGGILYILIQGWVSWEVSVCKDSDMGILIQDGNDNNRKRKDCEDKNVMWS